ncbi:MAG: hypothetical protein HY867_04380 [Chloroflexi bacterium]|nr:hypothetical protein [Chloroflexota bacterium]
MPKTSKSQKRNRQKIIRTTKRRLIGLIAFLSALALPLIFKWGETSWPLFLIEYRGVLISFLLLALLATIALSPLIIEVNSNARPLSGSGRNPYHGWDP